MFFVMGLAMLVVSGFSIAGTKRFLRSLWGRLWWPWAVWLAVSGMFGFGLLAEGGQRMEWWP